MNGFPRRYSWREQAEWIKQYLPTMRFTLNDEHSTICTVWITDNACGTQVERMGEILNMLLGAYLCGPMTNALVKGETHQSFGFWNTALIENARRIFPLPDGLQPGPPIYLGGIPDAFWVNVERAYNKRPDELPRFDSEQSGR